MADQDHRVAAPNSRQYGALTGATHVTAVPACNPNPSGGGLDTAGAGYRIAAVAVFNADNAAIDVSLFINNGSGTRYQLDQALNLLPGGTYASAYNYPNGILIRGPEFLELVLGGAADPAPVYYATWADVRP